MKDNHNRDGDGKTLPFFRIPQKDRDELLEKIVEFSDGDLNKIDARIVKTAVKSLAHKPGCVIVDKPEVVLEKYGETLLIPIKNQPLPVIVSVSFLRQAISKRL